MTKLELENEGWDTTHDFPVAIVLDDKTVLYASQDYEGNGYGALFGCDGKSGKAFVILPDKALMK